MTDIWFISDTHFFHRNIIEYEKRPFSSILEMNEVIINNWNKVVKENDIIYHLGDLALTNAEEENKIVTKLNGHKVLLLGNHDKRTITKYKSFGFDEVYKEIQIILPYGFVISHYPIPEITGKNVHGHVHSNNHHLNQKIYKCVSVELIDYTPIHLDEILKWTR